MESITGSLLVARPDLDDPYFSRSVVYIMDHSPEGAMGVILNQPLGALEHDESALAVLHGDEPLEFYDGGPVEATSIIALGATPGGAPHLVDIDAMIAGDATPARLRLFVGYSGWSPGQLDVELSSDSWFVLPARLSGDDSDDVFGARSSDLWRTVLRRQPPPLNALALYPEVLAAN